MYTRVCDTSHHRSMDCTRIARARSSAEKFISKVTSFEEHLKNALTFIISLHIT